MNYPQLSVQLYTVREAIQEDLAGTIARIAEIGFSQVEPYNFASFPGLGAALAASSLTAPTTHAHFVGISDAELSELFDAAKQLGVERVIELDDSRGDRFQAIADSFAFLTKEGLA